MTSPASIPLVLDVDTGIDDALALFFVCASPEAELVAVTCVGGNVEARQVEANTRAVLEIAGRDDVEVALGRETPLSKRMTTAPDTHGPQGTGFAVPAPASRPLSARHGADVIVETARERPGELTLVTLGPLTNLAVALDREPELPHLLRRWALMGGAFRSPGNTTPTSEWNIHVDPDAARVAFAAWSDADEAAEAAGRPFARPLAMGLDVTERARVFPADVVRLALRAGCDPEDAEALTDLARPMQARDTVAANPVLRFVVDSLRFYFEYHAGADGFYGAAIHDPFTVAAVLDPTLVRTEPVHVDVETGNGLAHGMTVADWRGLTGRRPNLEVAVEGDATAFLDRLIGRIGRLAAERSGVAI